MLCGVALLAPRCGFTPRAETRATARAVESASVLRPACPLPFGSTTRSSPTPSLPPQLEVVARAFFAAALAGTAAAGRRTTSLQAASRSPPPNTRNSALFTKALTPTIPSRPFYLREPVTAYSKLFPHLSVRSEHATGNHSEYIPQVTFRPPLRLPADLLALTAAFTLNPVRYVYQTAPLSCSLYLDEETATFAYARHPIPSNVSQRHGAESTPT